MCPHRLDDAVESLLPGVDTRNDDEDFVMLVSGRQQGEMVGVQP
jgi:hypothetical protein